MKVIVGGKKVVRWFKHVFPCKVYGAIKDIPANTTTLTVKGQCYTGNVTATWSIWDPKTHRGKYEVLFGGVSPLKVIYVEAVAYDNSGTEIDKAYAYLVLWGYTKYECDLVFKRG